MGLQTLSSPSGVTQCPSWAAGHNAELPQAWARKLKWLGQAREGPVFVARTTFQRGVTMKALMVTYRSHMHTLTQILDCHQGRCRSIMRQSGRHFDTLLSINVEPVSTDDNSFFRVAMLGFLGSRPRIYRQTSSNNCLHATIHRKVLRKVTSISRASSIPHLLLKMQWFIHIAFFVTKCLQETRGTGR